MIILNGLQSILSILIMISLGYLLACRKWFDEKSTKLLAKLVTTVSLPPLMISNLLGSFDRSKLASSGTGLLVPIISMGITYLLSIPASRIFKVNPRRRGVFQSMFFVSNTIFIGLPVNQALFGDISIPYVLLYYIGNTILFWTLGVYGIGCDGSEKRNNMLSLNTMKRIASPPLLGFILGMVLVLLNIKLPDFIMDTCKYLGNLTTPLSMIFIGITIHSIDLKKIRPSLDMAGIFLGRFIISPLVIVLLSYIFPMPELMKKVFIIQASMPVMTQTAIISKNYGADHEYTAIMIAVTTLASMVLIPIYMALL